ncbi:short chain dehydrogenase/reductase [Halenospora varia]|nr:short chain dehydrogenase/reductase [Halenospora varia]
MGLTVTILTLLGTIYLSRIALALYRFISIYILHTSHLPKYHHFSKTGSPPWALITGASDGIGRGYALALASHSFNLILHGRNQEKLLSVQKTLKERYPKIETRLLVLDASLASPESQKELEREAEKLKGLHITILINNVGTGTTPSGHVFRRFQEEDPQNINFMVNTNARFPLMLTRLVLPSMLAHAKPALILTMGSITEIGSPYLSTYSASKSFILAFARSLTREMHAEGRTNIEVLGIMTCSVTDTGTTCIVEEPRTVVCPGAEEFARAALARVGCRIGVGDGVVEGWWAHWLLRGCWGNCRRGWWGGCWWKV